MSSVAKASRREVLGHYIWITPAVILLFFFLVLPTFQTIYLSLHEEIKFSESQFQKDFIAGLADESGQGVVKTDLIQQIPGWEKVVGDFQTQYNVKIDPNDINGKMDVKDTSEVFIAAIYQARQSENGGQRFVGLKNYATMIHDPSMLTAFKNNLLWLVVFTIFTVIMGLAIATLADKVRWAKFAKTVIFLPMAISGVASAVIWYFMFVKDPGTGTINALISLFVRNFEGIGFLGRPDLVNFALISVGIWMQVGFCMVIFSAALQSVPVELVEMARIEGANNRHIFFSIEIPYIFSTIVLVITQMVIWVLKVFDIIFTLTNGGPFGASEVIANRIYRTDFNFNNFQYGSAMAVVLFIAIVPILFLNIRNLRREESTRE